MRSLALVAAACLAGALAAGATSPPAPISTNFQRALQGYNLVMQDPFNAISPTAPIFAETYAEQKTWTDPITNVVWAVPDALLPARVSDCSYTEVTSISKFMDANQFQDAYTASVSVMSGPVSNGAFTGSTSFKGLFTSSSTVSRAISHFRCTTISTVLGSTVPPPLSEGFIASVNALDPNVSPSAPNSFLNFLTVYGTHYMQKVFYGGSYFVSLDMNSETFDALDSSVVMAGIEAELWGSLNATSGFNSSASTELQSVANSTLLTIITNGAPPVSGGVPGSSDVWRIKFAFDPPPNATGLLPSSPMTASSLISIAYLINNATFPGQGNLSALLMAYIGLNYCADNYQCANLSPLTGAVAYFNATCPYGWISHGDSVGRLSVAVGSIEGPRNPVGDALSMGVDPTHTHAAVNGSFPTNEVTGVAASYISNGGYHVQPDGPVSFMVPMTGLAAPSGLPFVYLQTCRFMGGAGQELLDFDVPDNTILYFDDSVEACPDKWLPLDAASLRGRVLVPGPLASGPNYSAETVTPPQPVSHSHVVSGMTWSGPWTDKLWVGAGQNSVSMNPFANQPTTWASTTSDEFGVPYVPMFACHRQANTAPAPSMPPPARILAFSYTTNACPENWTVTTSADYIGRYVIGTSDPQRIATRVGANDSLLVTAQNNHSHAQAAGNYAPDQGARCKWITEVDTTCSGGDGCFSFADCNGATTFPYSAITTTVTADAYPYAILPLCAPPPPPPA